MGYIEINFLSLVKVLAIKNCNFLMHFWKYRSISTNAAMTVNYDWVYSNLTYFWTANYQGINIHVDSK